MTEKAKIIDMFYSGAFINIIGDSISAGAGSSESLTWPRESGQRESVVK